MAIRNGGIAVLAKIGDQIVIESEKMDVPPRVGEILEVIPHESRVEFRVRWNDGHESSIRPVASSYSIIRAATHARA